MREGVLRAVQALQAESGGTELCGQSLALRRISLSELLILSEGAFEFLFLFRAFAEFEPGGRGHLASAGVDEFRIVLKCRFDLMRFQMQAASLDGRFQIGLDVGLAVVDLAQQSSRRPANSVL